MSILHPVPVRAALLLCLLLVFFSFTAAAAPRLPWTGGFVTSTRGFSGSSEHLPGEYLDLGVFLDPFQRSFLNPSASMRMVLPLFPLDTGRAMVALGLDLDLLSFRNHPLRSITAQTSALSPALAAAWSFRIRDGFLGGDLYLTAHLLRLRTGDASYSFLSPELILDAGFTMTGWGLRLYDFSFFLF
jgi:hypothetical protein